MLSYILFQGSNLIETSIKLILDENCTLADAWAMVVSNISRPSNYAEKVVDYLCFEEDLINKLVSCFARVNFNKKNCNLNYLGKKNLC